MRGVGFVCDQCRVTAVDGGELLPDGWLEVSARRSNPFGDDHQEPVFQFCGWRCAERYAESAQPERVS